MLKLSNDEVIVKVIHGGVGAINESDVNLASASNAIIIGFNVRPDATARAIAEREKVDMRLYKVIYQAIADVEAAMKGLLDPIFEEKVIGHAVVRQTFKASGVGTIAGSYVLDGKFVRGCSCRVMRGDDLLFDGPMASLKRFKDDVKEVAAGYECGIVLEKYNDFREEDTIAIASAYLKIVAFSQIFSTMETVSNGLFTGLGQPKIPAAISIIFTILRIPMALIFVKILGVNGVWLSICISSILKGSTAFIIYNIKVRKEYKNVKEY